MVLPVSYTHLDVYKRQAVRMAVVELDGRRLHTNRMGDSLKNILKPFL